MIEYWLYNERLEHLTPPGERHPEVGLASALRRACGSGTVVEFGCGDGRLSGLFHPERYYGCDCNVNALAAASESNPRHRFGVMIEDADCVLAYTVLLHVPDEEIAEVAAALKRHGKRIVIGEILGRKWRTPGPPPCYNRERSEYEALFGQVDEVIRVPYPRYLTDLEVMIWYGC